MLVLLYVVVAMMGIVTGFAAVMLLISYWKPMGNINQLPSEARPVRYHRPHAERGDPEATTYEKE